MKIQKKWSMVLALGVAAAFAQESTSPGPPPSGWRKFSEARQEPRADSRPDSRALDVPPPAPSELTLPAGSWITIRVNQPLSSDHNQPGDAFTASLVQPLVANGRVVARRGQTVAGRVAEAVKAGHVKGTSRLGLQLTEISLVDGQQVPVRTQLVDRKGDTSVGRDVAAVGTTTAAGAAIGAAADRGFGAGMGAIAGAGASIIGVLATRGKATVVYPETVLTFRLEAPVTISTERSEEAFQPVSQRDYEQRDLERQRPRRLASGPPPPPYAYPYVAYYPPIYYGPSWYGPSLFFYSGPRSFYGRGFYRRW